MSKLPTLAAAFIGFCLTVAGSTAVAEEMVEIGVADENGASWHFADQLSVAWKTAYKAERKRFVSRRTNSVEHRFELLRSRQIRFAVGPLKTLDEERSKRSRIKVASLLWRVYLVAVGLPDRQESVGFDTPAPWYLPAGSLILPTAFPQSAEEPTTQGLQSVQTVGSIFESTENPASKIFTIDREALTTGPSLFHDGILLYETTGPVADLLSFFGKHLTVRPLHPQLIESLRKRIRWLDSVAYRRDGGKKIQTVGMTMALFTHNAEDPELVGRAIKLLNHNPYRFFPKSYLFDNLRSASTKFVRRNLLHDAAASYYRVN